jgi:hypothetical protein
MFPLELLMLGMGASKIKSAKEKFHQPHCSFFLADASKVRGGDGSDMLWSLIEFSKIFNYQEKQSNF